MRLCWCVGVCVVGVLVNVRERLLPKFVSRLAHVCLFVLCIVFDVLNLICLCFCLCRRINGFVRVCGGSSPVPMCVCLDFQG